MWAPPPARRRLAHLWTCQQLSSEPSTAVNRFIRLIPLPGRLWPVETHGAPYRTVSAAPYAPGSCSLALPNPHPQGGPPRCLDDRDGLTDEEMGWHLEHVGYVFVGTGEVARSKVMSSGSSPACRATWKESTFSAAAQKRRAANGPRSRDLGRARTSSEIWARDNFSAAGPTVCIQTSPKAL
jgi:hypothetical protein